MNLWRRPIHLTRKKRNELIEVYLLANPDLADDRIGGLFSVDRSTVNRKRKRLVQLHKLSPVEATVGKDGVKRKVGNRARWICESSKEYDKLIPNIRKVANDVHGLIRWPESETRNLRPFAGLQSYNTDSIHEPESEFSTPDWLFDHLNLEFNFSLDVCASPQNAKCARYFTSDDDGLSQSWAGETVFCNPPYHHHLISAWIKKAWEESRHPDTTVALLIPTYFREYAWWKKYCVKGEVRFIHPFIRFKKSDGEGTALKDVILIIFGKQYKPMTSGPVIGMKQTSA